MSRLASPAPESQPRGAAMDMVIWSSSAGRATARVSLAQYLRWQSTRGVGQGVCRGRRSQWEGRSATWKRDLEWVDWALMKTLNSMTDASPVLKTFCSSWNMTEGPEGDPVRARLR